MVFAHIDDVQDSTLDAPDSGDYEWDVMPSGRPLHIPCPDPALPDGVRLDRDRLRLVPVKVAEWRGLVFVALNDDAPAIEEGLGDLVSVVLALVLLDLLMGVAGVLAAAVPGGRSRRIVLCDRSGKPLGSWSHMFPFWAHWFDSLKRDPVPGRRRPRRSPCSRRCRRRISWSSATA